MEYIIKARKYIHLPVSVEYKFELNQKKLYKFDDSYFIRNASENIQFLCFEMKNKILILSEQFSFILKI